MYSLGIAHKTILTSDKLLRVKITQESVICTRKKAKIRRNLRNAIDDEREPQTDAEINGNLQFPDHSTLSSEPRSADEICTELCSTIIMESGQPLFATKSASERRTTLRRRGPLHTCGTSASAIACIVFRKAQNLNGPIGCLARNSIAAFGSTFQLIYAIPNRCLAFLSFLDDHILAIESIIEALFPTSTCVFDKVDKVVLVAEAFPGKFDDALEKVPEIAQQIPFLNSAVFYFVSYLNYLASKLILWDSNNNTSEKEIKIDKGYCNPRGDQSLAEESDVELKYASRDQASTIEEEAGKLPSRTYYGSFEMLEGRTEDIKEDKDAIQVEENRQAITSAGEEIAEKDRDKENLVQVCTADDPIIGEGSAADDPIIGEGSTADDPIIGEGSTADDAILQLFESCWHKTSRRGSLFSPTASGTNKE